MCGRAQIDGRATSAQLRGHRCPLQNVPPRCPLQHVPPRCPLPHAPPKCPPPLQTDCEHATSVLYCTSVAHSLDLCDQQLCTWHVSSCFDHTNWGSSLYKDGTRDAKVYFNIKVKNKVWWSKQPKKCISYTLEMPTSIERKYQIPNSRQLQCRKGVRP